MADLQQAAPSPTGKPPEPVTITGRLVPWDGEQPVYLCMPGSPSRYVACFATEQQLREVLGIAGVPFRSVKVVTDGPEFLSSFAGTDVVVIADLRFTPEGRVRFLQLRDVAQGAPP